MTRAGINDVLWWTSLTLECALLALVFLRGIPRRMPWFTLLLLIYPLRSVALAVLSERMEPPAYHNLYDALSLLGMLAQLAVAAEIGCKLRPLRWGWSGVVVTVLGALAGTVAMWAALPVRSPVPPDRLEIFWSWTMVMLWGWAVTAQAPRLVRLIADGLAAYAAVDLMAMAGKAVAALHRDAQGFAGWSYASTATYLVVIVAWL